MPRIHSLPRYEPEPGTNPLRAKAIQLLLSAASDPTGIEVGPLGMTRALKGTRAYHGTQPVERVVDIHPRIKELLGDAVEGKTFRHFDPARAGSGGGGDLYGEAIYLTEHPKVAASPHYGGGPHGMVRAQNIPPQAKILRIDEPLTKSAAKKLNVEDGWSFRDFLENVETPLQKAELKAEIPDIVRGLGYDALEFPAGELMGLPKGVPEGTRNWAVYNYDIINNPRKVAAERMPKRPKKTEIKKLPSRKELLPDEVHPFEIQQLIGGTFSGKQPFTGASAVQNINKRVEALKNALESGVLEDVMKKKGIWIP